MKQNYEITDLNKQDIGRLIQDYKINFSFTSNNDCLEIEEGFIHFLEELDSRSSKDSETTYTMDMQILTKEGGIKACWEIKSDSSYRNYDIGSSYSNLAPDYIQQFEEDVVDSLIKLLRGDLEPKSVA